MEIWIAILGLFLASIQLHLQRKEIQKATSLERLKIAADIIRSEIELREKIISAEKAKEKDKRDWDNKIQPHIDKVNRVLRPALRSVTAQIIDLNGGAVEELRTLPQHYVENDVIKKSA